MATSALQFSHVTLGYENIITTSDLNLTIPQGDYLCIIGENGSGKSTFVKNLLGLLKPLSGEIALTGDWKRSDIGYPAAANASTTGLPCQRSGNCPLRLPEPDETPPVLYCRRKKRCPTGNGKTRNPAAAKPLLSGTLRRSATACPTGTGTLCGSKAGDSG